jgi:glycosyltransferase involved in cell wall biosynthesis
MRICIPVEFKPQGGGFYFLRSFAEYLACAGDELCAIDEHYDVLFTSHWLVPRRKILRAMRRNPDLRIVQRVDGAAQDYGRDPAVDQMQLAVSRLSDLTVFQSEYARTATLERFRVIAHDGPVIHNPVDLDCFRPDGERLPLTGSSRVASVSWSTNPKKGSAAVYDTARRNPDITFYLCGRYDNVPVLPNVKPLGVLDRDSLATTLRSCDALLTYSENEACPNHVLEALASGLPVLYRDSGAMKEIIGDAGLEVAPDTFAGIFGSILQNGREWSRRARQRASDRFAPAAIFGRYRSELEAMRGRPSRLSPNRRWWLAWTSLFTQ